jgi:KDO2-lipid IV(A) lauroyltransferase
MTNPQFYAEWLALKALLACLERGDMSRAWARMRRATTVVKWIGRPHWLWALRNLQLVFGPQLDVRTLSRLASVASEQHLGSYLEGFRSRDVTIRGVSTDSLRAAYAAGRGVIVASVHLGSWEPGLRLLEELGMSAAVVYRRAFNPLSEREFQRVRASYGLEWIEADSVTRAVRALRKGKVLALMTDLNTGAGGVPAEFLGFTAMCPPGPAELALRYGCPIIPCMTIR